MLWIEMNCYGGSYTDKCSSEIQTMSGERMRKMWDVVSHSGVMPY